MYVTAHILKDRYAYMKLLSYLGNQEIRFASRQIVATVATYRQL